MCSEASFINSGFGKYAYEILSRWHKTNKYVVAEFASYGMVNDPRDKNIDWIYYANAVRDNDPRYKEYMSRTDNQFGRWRFEKVLLDFKPDVVVDVRDFWMSGYQTLSPLRSYFHHILMPTVDSAPQQEEWVDVFLSTDAIFTYSDWGAKVLKEQTNNKIKYIATTSPGVNLNIFSIKDKNLLRQKFNIPQEAFVFGSVMRNQKRKLIPELLYSLKQIISLPEIQNTNQKIYLYLHTTYPDMGWDIPELLSQYQVSNHVLFTYLCKTCQNTEACVFSGPLKVCSKCLNKTCQFPSVSNGVSDTQLSEIYNLFDLYVQYAICEGFGMPQVEAAACGVQIASVDYSAMTEIVEKLDGIKLRVDRMFREMEINADRAYPDNDFTAQVLYDFFINKSIDTRQANRTNIRNKCISLYSWDNVYSVWEEAFDSIDITKKLSWDDKNIPQIKNMSLKVPKGLNDKDFIEFICLNVINDPYLLNTANIQTLIKDVTNGIIAKNGNIMTINKQYSIDVLEGLLNNKIMCEKMRVNPQQIVKEDFI